MRLNILFLGKKNLKFFFFFAREKRFQKKGLRNNNNNNNNVTRVMSTMKLEKLMEFQRIFFNKQHWRSKGEKFFVFA